MIAIVCLFLKRPFAWLTTFQALLYLLWILNYIYLFFLILFFLFLETAVSGRPKPEICFLPGRLRWTLLPKERYGNSLSGQTPIRPIGRRTLYHWAISLFPLTFKHFDWKFTIHPKSSRGGERSFNKDIGFPEIFFTSVICKVTQRGAVHHSAPSVLKVQFQFSISISTWEAEKVASFRYLIIINLLVWVHLYSSHLQRTFVSIDHSGTFYCLMVDYLKQSFFIWDLFQVQPQVWGWKGRKCRLLSLWYTWFCQFKVYARSGKF